LVGLGIWGGGGIVLVKKKGAILPAERKNVCNLRHESKTIEKKILSDKTNKKKEYFVRNFTEKTNNGGRVESGAETCLRGGWA